MKPMILSFFLLFLHPEIIIAIRTHPPPPSNDSETINCINETIYCGWKIYDKNHSITWKITSEKEGVPPIPEDGEYLLIQKSYEIFRDDDVTLKSPTQNANRSGNIMFKVSHWGKYSPLLGIAVEIENTSTTLLSIRKGDSNEWAKTEIFLPDSLQRQPFKIVLTVNLYHSFSTLALTKVTVDDRKFSVPVEFRKSTEMYHRTSTIHPYYTSGGRYGHSTRKPFNYSSPYDWTGIPHKYSTGRPSYTTRRPHSRPSYTTRRPYSRPSYTTRRPHSRPSYTTRRPHSTRKPFNYSTPYDWTGIPHKYSTGSWTGRPSYTTRRPNGNSIETINCVNESSYCGWTIHDKDPAMFWTITDRYENIPPPPTGEQFLLIEKDAYQYEFSNITFKSQTHKIERPKDIKLTIWKWAKYWHNFEIGVQVINETASRESRDIEWIKSFTNKSIYTEWNKTVAVLPEALQYKPFKIVLNISFFHPFTALALADLIMDDTASSATHYSTESYQLTSHAATTRYHLKWKPTAGEIINCTNETSYCGWKVYDQNPSISWNITSDYDDIPPPPEGGKYLLIGKDAYHYGEVSITIKSPVYPKKHKDIRITIWNWRKHENILQFGIETLNLTFQHTDVVAWNIDWKKSTSRVDNSEWNQTIIIVPAAQLSRPFKIMLKVSFYYPLTRLALAKLVVNYTEAEGTTPVPYSTNTEPTKSTIRPYNSTGHFTKRPAYTTPDRPYNTGSWTGRHHHTTAGPDYSSETIYCIHESTYCKWTIRKDQTISWTLTSRSGKIPSPPIGGKYLLIEKDAHHYGNASITFKSPMQKNDNPTNVSITLWNWRRYRTVLRFGVEEYSEAGVGLGNATSWNIEWVYPFTTGARNTQWNKTVIFLPDRLQRNPFKIVLTVSFYHPSSMLALGNLMMDDSKATSPPPVNEISNAYSTPRHWTHYHYSTTRRSYFTTRRPYWGTTRGQWYPYTTTPCYHWRQSTQLKHLNIDISLKAQINITINKT